MFMLYFCMFWKKTEQFNAKPSLFLQNGAIKFPISNYPIRFIVIPFLPPHIHKKK